jgi:hypothetical protein
LDRIIHTIITTTIVTIITITTNIASKRQKAPFIARASVGLLFVLAKKD